MSKLLGSAWQRTVLAGAVVAGIGLGTSIERYAYFGLGVMFAGFLNLAFQKMRPAEPAERA